METSLESRSRTEMIDLNVVDRMLEVVEVESLRSVDHFFSFPRCPFGRMGITEQG